MALSRRSQPPWPATRPSTARAGGIDAEVGRTVVPV
jgi:hypothetical protein